jgi:hypothetical protein
MAFTLSDGGENIAAAQYLEFLQAIQNFQQFSLEEAGFTPVQKTVSLEEGLKQAPIAIRNEYGAKEDRINELAEAWSRYAAADPTTGVQADPNTVKQAILEGKYDQAFQMSIPTGTKDYRQDWLSEIKSLRTEQGSLAEEITNITIQEKTPERLALEARRKDFLTKQQDLADAILERQIAAQRGDLPLSETRERERQEEWQRFKDANLRQGRIIMGDSPEDAIGKGSAAEQALQAFKNQLDISRERERMGAMSQTPFAFQAQPYGQAAAFGQVTPISSPYNPNIAGLQGLNLALQPFQFNQNLSLQQRQLAIANEQLALQSQGGSQALWGAAIGAGGSILGGWLGR